MKLRRKITVRLSDDTAPVVVLALGVVAVFVFFCLLVALPTYFLWNWLMPALFGLKKVTLWQAAGLVVLCWLLFYGRPSFEFHMEVSDREEESKQSLIVVPGK